MLFFRTLPIIVLIIGFSCMNLLKAGDESMNQSWKWGQGVGLTDGTRPNDPATRQEVMTMFQRFYNLCTDEAADAKVCDMLPFTAEELDILYRIAWAEARGEDDKGLILVINVIMNRMESPEFRNQNTIRDVVFAPNQFEPTRNGAFDRAQPCQRIKDAVHRALQGEDYSRGALFFNAVRLQDTSWAGRNRQHIFNHGGHSFYL